MARRRDKIENLSNNSKKEIYKKRRALTDEEIQAQIDKSLKIVNEYSKKNDEIRRKRQGKTVNEYKEEIKQDEKKADIITRIKVGVFLIIVALISYFFARYSSIIGISINKEQKLEDTKNVDVTTTTDDLIMQYENEIIVFSNQVLKAYNKNGDTTLEYSFNEKFTPDIFVKNGYMVVINKSNGTIYFFNNKKEIFNKKLDGSIENIFLDEKGNMAVEYSTSGYKKIIGVYNNKGDELYNAYLSSDVIIGMSLLNNADTLVFIKSNASSFKAGIDISCLNVKEQNAKEEIIKSIDNKIVYDYFVKSNDLFLLLDDSIISLDLNNKEIKTIKQFDSNQLLYISLNDKFFSYIEKKNIDSKEEYILETSSYNLNISGTSILDGSPKMYETKDVVNYLVYQNQIKIYNKWGINIKNILIDYPPKKVIPFRNGRSLAIVYTNRIYFVKI